MEPINHFDFGFSLHHHRPIRRFSQAARLEEQHRFLPDDQSPWELQNLLDEDDDRHQHLVYPIEEYQFVDSCFNIDLSCNGGTGGDGDSLSSPDENHLQSYDSFLMTDDNEDVDMIVPEDYDFIDIGSLCEDVSSSSSSEMSVQPAFDNSTAAVITPPVTNGVDDGLHLVHLLLACAEAVACRNIQLADSILSQIWYSANPSGDSLQRVSYCFAVGLKSRLSLLHTGAGNIWPEVTKEDRIDAFRLLHRTTPYITFGFTAANDAIIQAAQGKDRIHIIDLGMEHTLQWPSLIRTFASMTGRNS